jgi:Tol biopolymer transport system component
MGEVYTANDSNLGRQVALKILPSHRTSDPDRVARFVREARASSALNHPAIVAVHDAGSEGDVHFLAMELIDGEPLSAWRKKSRGLSRLIEVMAQVAEGLARAHAHGIVHRDLKPDNIMISREGYAKIVDFGVAKLTERIGPRAAHTGITTPTSRVGTTAYMSPEQVEGRFVDHRADVFAFGTVLYELITGRNPFASPQYADTLHNIVHLDPPLEEIPEKVRRIVRRCLRKDPEERYQSIKDAALDLREIQSEGERAAVPRKTRLVRVALLMVLAAAGALWYWTSRETVATPAAVSAPSMRMTRLTNSGRVRSATISPDGRYLVYAEDVGDLQALFVKQIATGTISTILEPAPAFYYNLHISPDGNYVYYSSALRSEANIFHVFQLPLLGGTPRRIASDTEAWYSLSPDGSRIVFARINAFDREFRMTIASTEGGDETVVFRRKLPDYLDTPSWAPDGKSITVFLGNTNRRRSGALYRLNLGTNALEELDTKVLEKIPTPTWPGVGSYAWLRDGTGALVTARERDQPPQIWFVPTGSTTGRKVTSEVSAYYSVGPTADSKAFVTVRDTTDSNIFTVSLDAPTAPPRPLTTGFGNIFGAGGVTWLSASHVAYSAIDNGVNTFYVADTVGGGDHQRLIRNFPAWQMAVSPDGQKIAFVSDKSGQAQVWIADANGENARQLTNGSRAGAPSFTPDGKSVLYLSFGESQFGWRISVDGGTPQQMTSVPTSRMQMSPDGRWLLCRLRSKDGESPLWRTALMPADGKGPARYIFAPRYGFGPHFQWHPDSRGFLFSDTKDGIGNIWLQPIDGSEPQQLTAFTSGVIFSYDISTDGKNLVMARGEPTSDAVLISNWR